MGHESKITFCWSIPPSPPSVLIYLNSATRVSVVIKVFTSLTGSLEKIRSQNILEWRRTIQTWPSYTGKWGKGMPLKFGALVTGQAVSCNTQNSGDSSVCSPTQGSPSRGVWQSWHRRNIKHIRLKGKNAKSGSTVILDHEREYWKTDHFLLKSLLLDYLQISLQFLSAWY